MQGGARIWLLCPRRSGGGYRYKVALLTARYMAMSLPVWPPAFISLAVAMCSWSPTLHGLPNLVPLARDAARFNAVRSGGRRWPRGPAGRRGRRVSPDELFGAE